ncbi:unnamed protein product [Chrysodeixis includens]|uniref:Uncharacterized protein n=1 Tax=Chrysodeixis includens TaxID=689277 RepID=A0A9P0BV85_CHRIL|nr:unnamed protein product [Chrysodeixis includens]
MNLSENYRLREFYLKTDTVPTMSVMKKKMSENLAAVYFKAMTPRRKVIAGLEPSLKGGGADWYVPPEELLQGRAVLKPTTKQLLSKLNHKGIGELGLRMYDRHEKIRKQERDRLMLEHDLKRRNDVEQGCKEVAEVTAQKAKTKNTEQMINDFAHFTYLYRESLGKFELLFHEAAVAEIKKIREAAIRKMEIKFGVALKTQATRLYSEYAEKLEGQKNRIKNEFIHKLEVMRTAMGDNIHDLNLDKHLAIENLRKFLECQKLACQVYVALKERDKCEKEIKEIKHMYKKEVKELEEKIAFQDLEIYLAKKKEKKRQEVVTIWQRKICHVIKKFQIFVTYCLNQLPEYAEFFLNMEKLMLIQLSQVLEKPTSESIIEVEPEQFHTPIPKPKPFYLFCDRGVKTDVTVDEKLCPKQYTSSATQLPVIVINKRCIYAACDNFEQFNNKVKQYIHGVRGDDADFKDHNTYPHFVPIKYSSSTQLLDLKLESSLLQVLQQERPNIRDLPVQPDFHDSSCLCTPCYNPLLERFMTKPLKPPSPVETAVFSKDFKHTSKTVELTHEREPKWETFFEYVEPKKCVCTKKVGKKHLPDNLPPYMQRRSKYEQPELAQYEMCTVTDLKMLVKAARKQSTPPPVELVPSKTRNMSTQYEDMELEALCTCFTDVELEKFFSDLTIDAPVMVSPISTSAGFKVVGSSATGHLEQRQSSFATDQIHSLRNILEDFPKLVEVFANKDCSF